MTHELPQPTQPQDPLEFFRERVAQSQRLDVSEITDAQLRFGVRNGALERHEIAPATARVAVIAALNSSAGDSGTKLDTNIAYQSLS